MICSNVDKVLMANLITLKWCKQFWYGKCPINSFN